MKLYRTMGTQSKTWSFIGFWIIALFISIPFYTAQVYATPSIQITKNEGEDHLRQFIDAQGDTWTVEATITGTETPTINPQEVKIRIGSNERPFTSCNPSSLGIVCQYLSPLDRIQEAQYTFDVLYSFINELGRPDSVSRSDVIKSEGTAPQISGLSAAQADTGEVNIRFSVTDRVNAGAPFSGLQRVEIMDADTNAVLAVAPNLEPGAESYDYQGWEGFSADAKDVFGGDGVKRIKVRALDRLGHPSISSPASFRVDFVAPRIHEDSLELGSLGRFIGSGTLTTDVSIIVTEKGDLSQGSVTAESLQATFPTSDATCTRFDDPERPDDWLCRWSGVQVQPEGSAVFTITATDSKGNTATKAAARTDLVRDTTPPTIEYFGTDRQFEGWSYIKRGDNRIILRINEEGAGISREHIRANLGAFGRGSQENPDQCTTDESGITECIWNVQSSQSTDQVRMGLTLFEDNVGNEGLKPEVLLMIDNAPPIVENLQIRAYSPLAGEHEYFQSNDLLKITFTASERSGINILVDENNVVLDAENNYNAGYRGRDLPARDGIKVFTTEEGSCQRDASGEKYTCAIETDQIKSGPANSVSIGISIQDTAGNEASLGTSTPKFMSSGTTGKYYFDILGLTTEEAPDFWEVKKVIPIPRENFVDLDAAAIAPASLHLEVQLSTDNSQVKAIDISLVGCSPAEGSTAPELADDRSPAGGIVYASVSAVGDSNPKPKLILEFKPFDGRSYFNIPETEGPFTTASAQYVCQFRIFSKIGSDAVQNAEFQDVPIDVPFGFTKLGALDENLGKRITDLKEDDLFEIENVISYIDIVLKWLDYVARILNIIVAVNTFIDLFSQGQQEASLVLEKTPLAPYSAALRGQCLATQISTEPSWGFVKWVQVPLQILQCNPEPLNPAGDNSLGVGWYYYWQKNILEQYNIWSGRDLLGVKATSLYDNMYASLLGLCVPGIVYNINKAREIHCRKIVCYGREVPAGLATVDACNQLYDLQMCEYVWGPTLDFVGLGGFSYLGKLLKTAISSPVGLISLIEIAGCWSLCFSESPTPDLTLCKVTTGINKVVGIIDSIVSAVNNRPDITGSPYCDMAEDIDVNELTTYQRK